MAHESKYRKETVSKIIKQTRTNKLLKNKLKETDTNKQQTNKRPKTKKQPNTA